MKSDGFYRSLNNKGWFCHKMIWRSLFFLSPFPSRGDPQCLISDYCSSKFVGLHTAGHTSAKCIVECYIVQSVYCQHFRCHIWHREGLEGVSMLLLSFYALNILLFIWGTLQFPYSLSVQGAIQLKGKREPLKKKLCVMGEKNVHERS